MMRLGGETNGQDMSPGGTESDGWNAALTDYTTNDVTIKNRSSVLYNKGSTRLLSADRNGVPFVTDDIGALAFIPFLYKRPINTLLRM